jgi:prephenate dehydrogenase
MTDSRGSEAARGEPLFRRVTVVGVGLIGGSLGLAARQAGLVGHVLGVSRSRAHRETALRRGLVDEATGELEEALREADLVVLATPVATIVELLPEVARRIAPGTLVTDVGSVKAPIAAAGDAALPDGRFVAGHPIAGKERSGPEVAAADLFQGAPCILTPTARTRREGVERVAALWRGVGGAVLPLEAAWHDDLFASVSHLPHLAAFALMDTVLTLERDGARMRFAGGGLRDFTRIAGSDPVMWRDIFLMNRDMVLKSLAEFRRSLDRLETAIREGRGEGLTALLARARRAREESGHRS